MAAWLLHHMLIPCHFVTNGGIFRRTALAEAEGDSHQIGRVGGLDSSQHRDLHVAAGAGGQAPNIQNPFGYHNPVDFDNPFATEIVDVAEVAFVGNAVVACHIPYRTDGHRAGQVFEFIQGGVGCAVGPNQAVGTKIVVVGGVTKVAAVGPIFTAIGSFLTNTMINPLPNEAPL